MTTDPAEWNDALDAVRERVCEGRDAAMFAQATAVRMAASWALAPAPRDPVAHLVQARPPTDRSCFPASTASCARPAR